MELLNMDSASFKRAAVKTLQPKLTKAGLRHAAKTTARANLFHTVIELHECMTHTVINLTPYILGSQLKPELKNMARNTLAAVGARLVIAAKLLKLKVPASTKKLKLHGMTRTEALMELFNLTAIMSDQQLSMMNTQVATPEEAATLDQSLRDAATPTVIEAINLYWPLVYDTFGETPSVLFDEQFKAMAEQYGADISKPAHKAPPAPPIKAKVAAQPVAPSNVTASTKVKPKVVAKKPVNLAHPGA
jgi:hypothetical protein